jgi:hypothetical protein
MRNAHFSTNAFAFLPNTGIIGRKEIAKVQSTEASNRSVTDVFCRALHEAVLDYLQGKGCLEMGNYLNSLVPYQSYEGGIEGMV